MPATIVPSTPAASAPSAATCAPGPPQCAEVKPIRLPRLSLPIAVSVQNVSPSIDDARAAAQRHRAIGVRRTAPDTAAGRADQGRDRRSDIVRQRPLVLK